MSNYRPKKPNRPKSGYSYYGRGPAPAQQTDELAPDPGGSLPSVKLKAKFAFTTMFRKQIDRSDGAEPGDLVAVYSSHNRLLGYGLFNPRSEMALRMLWKTEDLPTLESWDQKLTTAAQLRQQILKLDDITDTYRVVHAESDEMPGMVIDRFGDVLSGEAFSLGMYQRGQAILNRLGNIMGTKHTVLQSSPRFANQEGAEGPTILSDGCPKEVIVQEHGTRFKVRFEGGHKTGFFCDQRDNRLRLADFCEGKSVLDLCCYTGGFSVQAMKLGKASEVTGVDLDENPLRIARENANLNQVRAKFVQSDAFNYMRDMIAINRTFDVVVLDPPKLIRNRAEIEEGTRKHFDLNRLAMRLVKPGGMLLSCTCAGLLPEAEFSKLLSSAARQGGAEISPATETKAARHAARPMQIIAKTGAAPCHPVGGDAPETEYLSAAWMILG